MKKWSGIIFGLLVLISGLLYLIVHLSSKYEPDLSMANSIDLNSVATSTEVSYEQRQMKAITPPSSTSTVQNCINKADSKYFDAWDQACSSFFEDKGLQEYTYCLSHSVTEEEAKNNKCNLKVHLRCDNLYPASHCDYLKDHIVYPTNCNLRDGSGKTITLQWEKEVKACSL